jgi:hypothetical protein
MEHTQTPTCSQYVTPESYVKICFLLDNIFKHTKGQTTTFELLRSLYLTEQSCFHISSELHVNNSDPKPHVSLKIQKLNCTLHLYGYDYMIRNGWSRMKVEYITMKVGKEIETIWKDLNSQSVEPIPIPLPIAETSVTEPKRRCCTICKQPGHNKATCDRGDRVSQQP